MRRIFRWWYMSPILLTCIWLATLACGGVTSDSREPTSAPIETYQNDLNEPEAIVLSSTPHPQETSLLHQPPDRSDHEPTAVAANTDVLPQPSEDSTAEPGPLEAVPLPMVRSNSGSTSAHSAPDAPSDSGVVVVAEATGVNRTATRAAHTMIPAPGPKPAATIGSLGPAPEYGAYLGSQTPKLSVNWVTPDSIMVGREGIYELVLRNPGNEPVEEVVIEQALPQVFRLLEASPRPERMGNQPIWKIDRLNPQQEARITLRLMPLVPGEAESHARVTFSTFATSKFQVVEPKLEIAVEAPKSVILGNQAIFTVTVRNPGTGPATNTALQTRIPEGLVHAADSPMYDLGTLNAGESRSIQVLADVMQLGHHESRFIATADSELRAETSARVLALGADLALNIDGPTFRYVTRPAQYTLRVRNTGTAPAEKVWIRKSLPTSFAFVSADDGGRFDAASHTANWYFDTIDAGQEIELQCELRATDKGEFPIHAQAVAERGVQAEAQHFTRVEGIAAILLEVVDVDDPVEVGFESFYEILVTNQGTDFATNVEIVAEAPEGITILGGTGPIEATVEGQTIRFAPLPKLAPRADAIYRVQFQGTRPGDFRMRILANADSLETPVAELESTKIYQD